MPVQVKDPTDIQSAYDDLGDPRVKSELSDAESRGSDGPYSEGSSDSAGDVSSSIKDSESNAPEAPNWILNRSESAGKNPGLPWSKRALKVAKKGGPITAIIGLFVGLGIGASMFFSPAMLLVHIKELAVSRFNIQSTALDARTNRILAKKLSSVGTSGCTSLTQVCKYSRMSNTMLKKLNDEGLVPVDKSGKPIEIKDGFGSERPYGFTTTDTSLGLKEGQILKASEFQKFLNDSPKAASTFRRVFNPTWSAFWDSTYMDKFLGRYNLDKSSRVNGDTEEDVKNSFNEQVDGTEKERLNVGAKSNPDESNDAAKANQAAANQADNLIDAAGTQTADDLAQSLGKEVGSEIGGKLSGGAMLIANLYCMASSSGAIAKAIRVIQMGQIIAYGLLFLQAADEIMAGNGSPAKAAFFGTALTTVIVDSATKTVKKKAATDSVGMKYLLLGDKGATSTTSDYTKYLPGGGIVSMLQQFSSAISGKGDVKKALDQFCAAVNSDAAQGLELLLDFTPVGLTLAVVGWVVGQFSGTLLAPILGMLAGKIVDSTTQSEDLGNAAATGIAQSLSEGSNAGAMMALTPTQASAYLEAHKQTQLADARIDRATRSPFDISSPNTFLGSIMTQLIPYYGSMQTVSGTFGSVLKLVGSSFSSMVSPKTSALGDNDIGGCPDTALIDANVAVGKLCNVWYGIPTEYFGIDPDENQTSLEASGQLTPDGTPVAGSELETYLNECATGDGSAATADCVVDSEKKARYALSYIDRRLQRDMDGEDVVTGAAYASSAASGTCPAGTDIVSGLNTGWNKETGQETAITLCSIPNTEMQVNPGWTNKKYQGTSSKGISDIVVNAEAAQGLLDASKKYTQETGQKLSASVAYRSVYEQCSFFVGGHNTYSSSQADYYNKYCTPNKSWLEYPSGDWNTNVVVSNHMMGYSIDFLGASESWMRTCVGNATDGKSDNRCYGFYDDVYQKEKWDSAHFTFSPA